MASSKKHACSPGQKSMFAYILGGNNHDGAEKAKPEKPKYDRNE
jgi:hypothetical protein